MNSNKFYLQLRFCLIYLAVLAPLLINNTFALEPAYWWHDTADTKFSKPDWMAGLPDEIPLDRISMVGTHDSCGYKGGDAFRSQRLSLTKQLTIGIRAMDIWTRHSKSSLYINHGIWYQGLTFDDVIKEVATYLYNHKKETVIMRISPDGTSPDDNKNTYEDAFKVVYNKYSNYFWKGPYNVIPKLKDIRGKIVILQKFPSNTQYGIPWSNLKVQDHYQMRTNWDLYDRWERVKKHINDSYDSGGGKGIYLNYLTGSGGSFPYFVASGKSSPQTGAPWLMTGKTTPGWKNSYVDWPRINCFIGICSIPFVGTNYGSSTYIKNKHSGKSTAGYVGILLADFPGQELIENVVAVNFPLNPQYLCIPGFTSCNGVCVDLKNNKTNCGQCGNACWFGANSSATCNDGVCGLDCLAGFSDCDKIPTNGCEKSLSTITDCLSCGNKCPIPSNGAPICTTSGCSIGDCSKPFAKCGSDSTCTTNTDTSIDNCGGCGKKCSAPTNGSATCSAGACGFTCAQNFTKCGNNCVSQTTDINNCGGCGIQCPKPANGVAICENGTCGISNCPSGLANCDKDLANGCETSILSDILSCGNCSNACKIDNAASLVCLNGSCGISSCDKGWAQCGNQNGCLTNINTDFNNCGGCSKVCNLNNAQSSCSSGSCKVDSCSNGFKDCNAGSDDGCEINSLTDVNNCGACGTSCAKPANGEASCTAGVCGIKTCDPGFADCDGKPENGCEVNISSDENNCSGCGKICSAPANGIAKCESGTCGLKECIAGLGFMDCDKLPTNGCETPINTVKDCGGCGPQFTCTAPANASPLCMMGGSCATGGTCNDGFKDCNNQSGDGCEVNLTNDVNNCGTCGNTCQPQANGSPPTCTNGTCDAGVCPTGLAHCPGDVGCQTPLDTINNCGGCGDKCSAPTNKTPTCSSGACGISPFCNEGYGDCDGDPLNGCETDVRSSSENCGSCKNTCNLNNSAGICSNSQCVPGFGTCQAGFAHCTGPVSSGCETPLNTVDNCGGCGNKCSSQGGTPSCGQDGKCSIACIDGFADCNNDPSDGCEVDLKTSEQNCNACGVACNNTNNSPTCNAGNCITGNCSGLFGKCGDDIGCATPLNTDENCGACGKTCNLSNVAVSKCSIDGKCSIVSCKLNFVDCNQDPDDGCEVDITKVENCGACGTQCPLLANTSAPFCKNNQGNYSCGIGTCLPGYAHYSSNENDGCETNTNTDVNHCGSNNIDCPSIANGTPACTNGVCGIGTCNENFVDKNNNPSDGCEINIKDDILNCGAIGNICSANNGTPNCVDGKCGIQCDSGYSDCNEQPGCETNILTTPEHCGKCGTACSTANNSPSCVGGSCVAGTCSKGFGQCSGDPGCNTPLNTDNNCGSCGHTCSLPSAASSCSEEGKCIVSSCLPGKSDCNGDPIDGCETDITNIENCGRCGLACNNANNTPICTTGNCIIGQCLPGFAQCGSDPGCNTQLNTDNNCGGCGKTCNLTNVEVSKCSLGGECSIVECKDGFLDCNGIALDGCERNITTINDCGACNNKCNLPLNTISTTCNKDNQGIYSCGIGTCAAGFGNFDGNETNGCESDTNTDVNHCGPNNINCPSIPNGTPACTDGKCGIGSCNENFVDKNKNPSDGCEVNLKDDKNNCGAVGNICSFANASAKCEDGKCILDTCDNGFGLCGGSETCLPLSTVENCGSCTNSCSFPNATSKCENGDCKLGICLPGFALCGGDTCLNLSTDENNCAKCGSKCPTPSNGSPLCSAGLCDIACNSNYVKCGGSCLAEASLSSDLLNCGGCGIACNKAPANGAPLCQGGACDFSCDPGYRKCGNSCVSESDINNCGGCGNICGFANGTPRCENNQCVLAQCNLGYDNCDGNQANGCEKEVNTSSQCGSCNNTCPEVGNREPACILGETGGTCGSAICLPGFSDCDGKSENGCESILSSNVNHCGACGTACTSPNGQPVCDKGLCTTGTCDAGFSDCNKTPGDGCEINISGDINNCGGCNIKCSFANGVPRCDNGQCVLDSCAAGFGNCNNVADDGCELLVNSNSNCGGCGNICEAPANRDPICLQGLTCGTTACATGYDDCDGNASNGCEANLNTSTNSCGACGNTCNAPLNANATCSAGFCDFVCKDGYTRCGKECISTASLASDTNNCGGCGNKCTSAPANGAPACIGSACSSTCDAGYTKCGDSCIPNSTFLTDTYNCGSCGNKCGTPANGSPSCQNGTCGIASCSPGFANCDGIVSNGCETNILSTDILNCGGCGTICSTQPNGSPAACVSGSCAAGSCSAPYLKCASDTGCNTNTNTSTSNCGDCGISCNATFGIASCLGGSCGITCDSSHADCSSAAPGCETSINTTQNCGGCGLECNLANANENCTLSTQGYVCGISTCLPGYGNCDNNSANGCETLLNTDNRCGACGTVCGTTGGTRYSCQPQGDSYACKATSCSPGLASCLGGSSTCETNTNTSATNCGGCGNNCTTLANSSGNTCSSGSCLIGSCSSGYANCNGAASDGCEASLSSILSCGACGNNCNNLQNTIGNSCTSNSCSIGTCISGYGNCDNLTSNGCESALNSSLNCGGCGLACNISGQNCNPTNSKCEGGVFSYYAYVLLRSNDIAQYGVDSEGRLSISTNYPTVSSTPNTTYLNFSPDGTRIFVTSSNNQVSFFTENKTTKTLVEDQAARIGTNDPISFVISPDGKFAWIIGKQLSQVTLTSIGATTLTIIGSPYSTEGGKPVDGAVTPDGKYFFALNQDTENIVQFLVNKNTGSLTPNGTVSAIPPVAPRANSKVGPTKIKTSPDGRFVYVTNGNYNQVLQYSIGYDSLGVGGKLTYVGSTPTGTDPVDLFVSPTGKFAYVVNNGSDTVTQYSIGSNGALTSLGTVSTGDQPVVISVSYNGKYAYISNKGSKNISQYSIGTDGKLTPMVPATVPTPGNSEPGSVLVH